MFKFVGFGFLKQFEKFEKEGGLLPSFSVEYKFECLNYFHRLTKICVLGDYSFYLSDDSDNEWFISIDNLFISLKKSTGEAVIYNIGYMKDAWQHDVSYLLMQGYMYRLVECGGFMIHSAAVIYENCGIVFCGLSGAGKSTQANLWRKYLKTEILNYDKPCVLKQNDSFYIHGSPWSGKEGVYKNKYVKLRAIVFVNKDTTNHVERIMPTKAYANLFLHNYVYPITTDIEEKYTEIIRNVVEQIPVYELFCDISETAVQVLFKELFPDLDYQKAKEDSKMMYKVKESFVLKEVADEFIVTKRGAEAIDFGAVVVFNKTGAFLWKQMTNYITVDELAQSLSDEYALDFETAKEDCTSFIEKMNEDNMLDQQ